MAAAEIEVLSVVSADGTRIGCEVDGTGPPLLLVHGSTADRSRWAVVREALAPRFTLHLMDRRERGRGARAVRARAGGRGRRRGARGDRSGDARPRALLRRDLRARRVRGRGP